MRNKFSDKILAFILALSFAFSIIPPFSIPFHAEGEINYGSYIGTIATWNAASVLLAKEPSGESGSDVINGVSPSSLPSEIVVTDYSTEGGSVWYKVDAAPGYEWPSAYSEYHWTYAYSIYATGNTVTGIYDSNGNNVSFVTLPLYDKIELTADTSLQGGVSYQWQIEYESGKWVDIYGENEPILTVSIALVASLLSDDHVNVRCVTSSASKTSESTPVMIFVDFSDIGGGNNDPVIPETPTVDILMNGVSADSITTTYGNHDFQTTLTASTTLNVSVSYKWEVLTDSVNDLWAELSTDSACTFVYNQMHFKVYDETTDISTVRLTVTNGNESLTDYFYVYRIAETYITNNSGDTTDKVDVTVAGVLPQDASLDLEDASDTTIGGVDPSEIALALNVSIKQNGEEWQPGEGETVRVSIPAAQLGLVDGQYFTVYHIHDGQTELLGPYVVDNGYVTFDIDGFSVVVISTNYGAAIGAVAGFSGATAVLDITPVSFNGMTVWVSKLPESVVIKNYYFDATIGTLYYEIDAAPGYTWPAEYTDMHWCYSYALTDINVNGTMGVFDENGVPVDSITISTKNPMNVTAVTSLQSGAISYKWQICYDKTNDLWADISGQTSSELTVTVGIVASLADANGHAMVRCIATAGSKSTTSEPIIVMIEADAADDNITPELNIKIDGVDADSIDVNDAEKDAFSSTLSAETNLTGTLTYQWEVLSDSTNNLWEVLGTEDTFVPSFDLYGDGVWIGRSYYINNVDETTDTITIRLTVSDGITTLQDIFNINIKYSTAESYSVYNYVFENPVYYANINSRAGETTTTYNVIIKYMNQDGTATFADPYTSTVSPTTVLTNTISFPKIVGYAPKVYNQSSGKWERQDSYTFDGTLFTSDFTLEVRYYPDAVQYKVNIYIQNAENDEYVLMNSYIREEFTGTVIDSIVHNIDGYYQSKFSSNSTSIAADGSTEFNLYYDRFYYLMKFDLDGGYGVQPIYARHGVKLDIPSPTKAGYTFVGWDQTEGKPAVNNEILNDGIANTMYEYMPIGNTSYKAIWIAVDNAKVTIVYWGENANNENYSYLESQEIYVKPGTSLTFGTDQRVCTLEQHTHGSGCTYNCGLTPHTHSLENNCYTLNCDKNTHNHTESRCKITNCTYASHVHDLNCYVAENGNIVQTTTPNINNLENWTSLNDGIYTYTTTEYFIVIPYEETHYLVKIGDTWYCSSEGDENDISLNCTHTHTDVCYDCGLIESNHVHTISNGCYSLICTTKEHTHSADCYSCVAHTHNENCYLKVSNQDSTLWTYVISDTVTVAADGSTVMNVYYDRVSYNVEFHSNMNCTNEYTQLRITAKWGESILDKWPTYEGSSSWLVKGKSNTWQNSIQVMPVGGAQFWGPKEGDSSYKAYYYVEALPSDTETIVHNGITYKLHHTDVSSSRGNVTDEERYGIEGFIYKEGTENGNSYNNAKFYYIRSSYSLEFNNGEDIVKTESVKYQYSLSAYNFTPNAPSYYESGSVEFAGWYQNPECTGDEVILNNMTMPATNVILYAKWVPVKHNVTVYRYKNADGLQDLLCNHTDEAIGDMQPLGSISHGDLLSKHYIPEEPTNGNYKFVTWAYYDKDLGKEVTINLDSFVVTKDVEIYAVWSSNVQIPYTIKYMIDGTTTEIAKQESGKYYAGETHTFEAKTAGQLLEGYQTGYFPLIPSHSIAFDEDDESYEYIFYYVQKDAVPYTVYYVTENQNEAGTLTPIQLTEGEETKMYYIVADTKVVSDNRNAIVTENFTTVQGYMPDAYQKTLIIDGSDGAVNQIIFKYSVDTTHAYYKVNHYTQNIDGSWYTYDSYELVGDIGTRYSEAPKNITGFTYNKIEYVVNETILKDGITSEGAVLTADGLEINLYYIRNKYPYKVEYREQGTNSLLYDVPDLENQYYGDTVSHTAPQYWGDGDIYERVSAEKLSTVIQVEENENNITKNIIVFYYIEREVQIDYVVVGGIGGTVNPSSEIVLIKTGTAQGSTAEALPGYKFVGWYDINNNQLSTELHYTPEKVNGINEKATYYAKFEELEATINYVIVDPDGNQFTADQTWGKLSPYSEKVTVVTGTAEGSQAMVLSNIYKFVGWYSDAACENLITTNAKYIPTKAEDKVWLNGITYYAKFDYNLTSLTIKKAGHQAIDENQTFIFNISGNGVNLDVSVHGNGSVTVDGLTVGSQYTITEKTSWSWRYSYSSLSTDSNVSIISQAENGAVIQIGLNGTITFTNDRSEIQWLDGDSWCDNLFK